MNDYSFWFYSLYMHLFRVGLGHIHLCSLWSVFLQITPLTFQNVDVEYFLKKYQKSEKLTSMVSLCH